MTDVTALLVIGGGWAIAFAVIGYDIWRNNAKRR